MKKTLFAIAAVLLGCEGYEQYYDAAGVLDLDPVAAEQECYQGNVCAGNPDSLEAVSEYRCIDGDINLRFTTQAQVDAVSHLERINGVLNISYSREVVAIEFPHLQVVTGIVDVYDNGALGEIAFDSLQSVESLLVELNPKLTVIDAPALAEIDNQLTVQRNKTLELEETCMLLDQLTEPPGGLELNEWEHCGE